jgi:hypothetical protein
MLKNIELGEISAEVELEINPEFVKNRYYDFDDTLNKLINKHHFIVLGNKGSGKSMIGVHLRLNSGPQSDGTYRYTTNISLDQFPYKSFKKIISGSSEAEAKLPMTWKWLLLIYAYKTFRNDLSKECEFDAEFNSAVEALQQIGVLPADIGKIAMLASKKSFKLKLPIFEASYDKLDQGGELHYLHIVEYLEKIILKIRSDNKHLLIIDGLDYVLSARDIQYESLAALVSEARDINKTMRENGTPFKIIVLCRKDLYKKLPGTNKNKITNAFTIDLNWYQDQVDVNDKEIVRLAVFRANLAGEKENIFEKYFPKKIDDKNSVDYILENTRYTPRDFLRLLTYIGQNSKDKLIKFGEIRTGIKDYSNKYFWPEIEDELDGYLSKEEVSCFKRILVQFNKREFMLHALTGFVSDNPEYASINLLRIMEILYECGAISNKFEITGGNEKYQSRMKDDNDFNKEMKIVLHRGMWKALNMG